MEAKGEMTRFTARDKLWASRCFPPLEAFIAKQILMPWQIRLKTLVWITLVSQLLWFAMVKDVLHRECESSKGFIVVTRFGFFVWVFDAHWRWHDKATSTQQEYQGTMIHITKIDNTTEILMFPSGRVVSSFIHPDTRNQMSAFFLILTILNLVLFVDFVTEFIWTICEEYDLQILRNSLFALIAVINVIFYMVCAGRI